MSEEKSSPVDQMKDWARRAPPPDGPRANAADMLAEISNGRAVAVLLTDKGQVYLLPNVDIAGQHLKRFPQPRSGMNELMDSLGIVDGPDWAAVKSFD